MADTRKSFLLRIDARILDAMRRWAEDDLRSLNGQVEFVLRRALQASGRWKRGPETPASGESADGEPDIG